MGLLSNIFSKKEYPEFDCRQLSVDMHSHLIPGIDDGANSIEDSLEIIRAFKSLGYRKLITTPHIKMGSFENSTEIIRSGAKLVQAAIKEHNIDIEFEAAAEYYFDYSFIEKIEANDILSFSDGHVLVEYSFHQKPMGYKEMIYALQLKGYKPILAHFERYPYYHGRSIEAEELRNRGVKIQINILSLFGHYGPQIQKQAELLVKEGQVDLLGSDCHRIEHLDILRENLKNATLNSVDLNKIVNSHL